MALPFSDSVTQLGNKAAILFIFSSTKSGLVKSSLSVIFKSLMLFESYFKCIF